ncbi:hypothetical protein OUO20_05470 [Arthrobacter sp. FX8]|uniref:hypothetical protein n=1 Tax=Arthrobacter sp. FX8 TaxID=2997335 RepID=UPI00227A11BE|nr:hypothetical protein [Arthrobacter sp. FX8]WAJ34385.1 hypothetical protein OUO20_05470 [Arthrobacter sp. FX8]
MNEFVKWLSEQFSNILAVIGIALAFLVPWLLNRRSSEFGNCGAVPPFCQPLAAWLFKLPTIEDGRRSTPF